MNENEYKLEIYVTKDNVTIKNKEKIHTGEYKITKCEFEFTEDYEGLTKKAIFEAEDVIKEMPIISNECDIPEEVLQDGYLQCNLRVYGYDIEEVDGEMAVRLRYSPTYDTFPIWRGSFIPNAEQGEEITPTQFEQYTAALNEGLEAIEDKIGEVNTALENVSTAITQTNNLNLDVNKVDDTATVTLTKKDGTTKTVEITDGKDGEDGYTPVKGVDYYTEEEVEEIVNEITEKAEKDVAQANLVYNALPKVTGSGEEITLNNTAETPLKLTLKGNTYQETTTGKNLLSTNSFTLVKGTNRTLQINFATPIPAGTYTLSCKFTNRSGFTSTGGLQWALYDSSTSPATNRGQFTTITSNTTSPLTSTITITGQATHIYIYLLSTLDDSATITIDELMLESGNQATTYEPYTNGASPNPDYPQEVQVVTGDNTIKVQNANLLNRETCAENKLLTWAGGITSNETGSLASDFIKIEIGKTYQFTYKVQLLFYDKDKTYLGAMQDASGSLAKSAPVNYNPTSATIPNNNQICYMRLGYRTGNNSGVDLLNVNIMVNEGNTLLNYIPHQEQNYEINLGKNLFDESLILNATGWTLDSNNYYTGYATDLRTYFNNNKDIIKFEANTQYTISLNAYNGTATSPRLRITYTDTTYSETSNFSSTATDISLTSTANKTIDYITMNYGTNGTIFIKNMQIEAGTEASSYSPYFTPIELCKIGTYQDYLYKSGENWYKHTEIGKVVLDGSENWSYRSDYNAFYLNDTTSKGTTAPISNYFKGITSGITTNDNSILFNTSALYLIYHALNGVVSDFETWLSTHNVTIYYQLATPTEEQITNAELIEQLNDLYYATSYQNQTNINSSGNRSIPMDAIAVRDLSNIFTNEE